MRKTTKKRILGAGEYPKRFLESLSFVAKWEGGLTQDPDDPGGRTYKGVTQARYNQYRKERNLPPRDVAKMTDSEYHEIYYIYYWSPSKANMLPEPLDLVVFDTAVNMGVVTSAKLLQKAINDALPESETKLIVDGKIGNETLQAIERLDTKTLVKKFLLRRKLRYYEIANKNPKLKKFLRGWLNRVYDLSKIVGALRTKKK